MRALLKVTNALFFCYGVRPILTRIRWILESRIALLRKPIPPALLNHAPPLVAFAARHLSATAEEPGQPHFSKDGTKNTTAEPLISIITPVYNVPPCYWRETAQSVLSQTHSKWEWCVVDGGSAQTEWRAAWNPEEDRRIRFKKLDTNLGISGNTMAAVQMAAGSHLLFLDHDDLLAPDALQCIADTIRKHPSAGILYYDEDKVTEDGRHIAPFLKPEWSPHTLLSANYLTHAVYAKKLFDQGLALRSQYDGAQDWDLALRATQNANVIHIPRILYHWRIHAASTSTQAVVKPWTLNAQKECLADFLRPLRLHNLRIYPPAVSYLRLRWENDVQLYLITTKKDGRGTLHVYEWEQGTSALKHHRVIEHFENITAERAIEHFASMSITRPDTALTIATEGAYKQCKPSDLRDLAQWSLLPAVGFVIPKTLINGRIPGIGHCPGNPEDIMFPNAPPHGIQKYGSPDWYHNPEIQCVGNLKKIGLYNVYTPFVTLRIYPPTSQL